jgi:hypothetical protein
MDTGYAGRQERQGFVSTAPVLNSAFIGTLTQSLLGCSGPRTKETDKNSSLVQLTSHHKLPQRHYRVAYGPPVFVCSIRCLLFSLISCQHLASLK